jgi:acid phosphatase
MTRRTARFVIAFAAVCALGAMTALTWHAASTQQQGAIPVAVPTVGRVASSSLPASRPDHVVIVMMENKNEDDALREGPYLASLAAEGTSLTDMHAETHPSQPNYLALFSGDPQGVDDDTCPLAFGGANIAGELIAAGYTFVGYSEDLPGPGYTGCRAGDYARKHSPWTDFPNLPPGINQPLSAMPADYAALPTVSFVIPNLCHDMHDCSIVEGDNWLRQNIDGYAQWARTHNSLLIVSFDESESARDHDNHIATVAVGERVVPGAVTARTDHYALLRTVEDLYGLPPLGHSSQATAIPELWKG